MAEIAFALVLGFAAIIASLIGVRVRKTARAYLMFAAALYGSLAIGDAVAASAHAPALADAIAFLVAALGPAALVLGMTTLNSVLATLILSLCLVCGIYAGASREALAAFAPLFASACAMLVLALRSRRNYGIAAALCFLAAAASFMSGPHAGALLSGRMAFGLFSAAGLIGASLMLASGAEVARKRKAGALAIRSAR